jgi:cytidylate kinase
VVDRSASVPPWWDRLDRAARARGVRYVLQSGLARFNIRGDQAVDDTYMPQMLAELASKDAIRASDAEVTALGETGGVVLGRGAPRLLAGSATTLRVLLTGPVEARIAAAVARDGLDLATATQNQRAYDASRAGIAAKYYHDDPDRVGQYHLIIDTTALGDDLAIRFIVEAQRAL